MAGVLGLEFHSVALGPGIVNGITTAALYGVIAVALVLSFRMSRTVAFVHGGIAMLAGYLYWYLTFPSAYFPDTKRWPVGLAILFVVIIGGITGTVYGTLVMGRMKTWPRVTVTTFSLGVMLLVAGLMASIWIGLSEDITSPFGNANYQVFGQRVSRNELVELISLIVLVAVLTFVLNKTRTGTYVRAIADDIEAASLVGIPVEKVGTGVWAMSGMVAALAGVLIAAQINVSLASFLLVMLRAFTVAMIGGFSSLPLVIVGGILFGLTEAIIGGGAFGNVDSGLREVILMGFLLGTIYVLFKFGHKATQGDLLEAK
jgi:branched-subunit amino acid ABC-type transport system permease component